MTTKKTELNQPRVRTTLIILLFKVFLFQLLFAFVYFCALAWVQLASSPINELRIIFFLGFQAIQTAGLMWLFLKWFYRWYAITDKEVVMHEGVFARNSAYYSLERAESASLKQSLLGSLFNYGTIRITINHSDHRDLVCIKNVPNPRDYIEIIENNLQDFNN